MYLFNWNIFCDDLLNTVMTLKLLKCVSAVRNLIVLARTYVRD